MTDKKRGRPKKQEAEGAKTESFYAHRDCLERLQRLCAQSNQSKGDVICEALKAYEQQRA